MTTCRHAINTIRLNSVGHRRHFGNEGINGSNPRPGEQAEEVRKEVAATQAAFHQSILAADLKTLEALAAYALEQMGERGVTFKLKTRLADARPGAVILNPSEEIRAGTLVWTAGAAPNPLIETLPVAVSKRGAVEVDIVQTIDVSDPANHEPAAAESDSAIRSTTQTVTSFISTRRMETTPVSSKSSAHRAVTVARTSLIMASRDRTV